MLRKKLAGVLEIYEKFVGEDPYKNPMRVFPAVHYTMGGLWVDFERSASGSLVMGSPRNQATNIPGSTPPARSTTSTTAPTGSAPTRCSRASGPGW
jgi:succinate dehydrogenase/fumarate reductase flavoprotein subunit